VTRAVTYWPDAHEEFSLVRRLRNVLAAVGAAVRGRLFFTLQLAALLWGVAYEGVQPANWRRTPRKAFRGMLTRLTSGSLSTVAVTAILVGVGLVFQALFWLRTAGQENQIGRILVVVLIREITPLLIGIILLGRGGTAAVAEIGALKAEGELAILRAEGLDLFQLYVLPTAAAYALAAFTLGMVFCVLALVSGFVTGSIAGVVSQSIFGFLDLVLRALTIRDLAIFPIKLVLIGVVVALACCITGLAAGESDGPTALLPRGFTRGIAGILTVTVCLSVIL
jgi:phospholipid/cholesterol/gamma-HCH transport system permease protein